MQMCHLYLKKKKIFSGDKLKDTWEGKSREEIHYYGWLEWMKDRVGVMGSYEVPSESESESGEMFGKCASLGLIVLSLEGWKSFVIKVRFMLISFFTCLADIWRCSVWIRPSRTKFWRGGRFITRPRELWRRQRVWGQHRNHHHLRAISWWMRWSASFMVVLMISSAALFGEHVGAMCLYWCLVYVAIVGTTEARWTQEPGTMSLWLIAPHSPILVEIALSEPPLNWGIHAGWTALVRDLSIATQNIFLFLCMIL